MKAMIRTISPFAAAAVLLSAAFAQNPPANTPSPGQQAELLYRQGLAAVNAGDPAAAQLAFSNALRINPNHANARYNLGQVKINAASIAARGREAKFGSIMIPEFRVDDASLRETIDLLRILIERESKEKSAPNFIIQDPKNELGSAKISLNLQNVPSRTVMQHVLDMVGAKARYDEYAIVITPK